MTAPRPSQPTDSGKTPGWREGFAAGQRLGRQRALVAVDREAWARRVQRVIVDNGRWVSSSEARAVVDALLDLEGIE